LGCRLVRRDLSRLDSLETCPARAMEASPATVIDAGMSEARSRNRLAAMLPKQPLNRGPRQRR
jgi:hypothetical protein